MTRLLKMKKLRSIGLVDVGESGDAEHRPSIVIFKRLGDAPQPVTKQEGSTMGLDEILAAMPEEQRAVVMAALEEAGKATEVAAKAADEPPKEDDPPKDEEIAKALKEVPEAVRAHFVEVAKRAEKAEAGLKVLTSDVAGLTHIHKRREYGDKAKAFDGLGLDHGKLTELMHDAGDNLKPEMFTELEGIFKRATAIAKSSKLFKETGSSGDALGNKDEYGAKLEEVAKRIKAADPKITEHVALVRAAEQTRTSRKGR